MHTITKSNYWTGCARRFSLSKMVLIPHRIYLLCYAKLSVLGTQGHENDFIRFLLFLNVNVYIYTNFHQ